MTRSGHGPTTRDAQSPTPSPGYAGSTGQALADLTRRAVAGDESAFARLHERYAPGLLRFFTRRCDRLLAEDLAQSTWAQVWQALRAGRYDPGRSALSTFVYAVACKVWLQHRRQGGRQHMDEAVGADEWIEHLIDPAGSPDDLAECCELLDVLRACLNATQGPWALTSQERAIVMGLSMGRSQRELAGALGLAPSTVNERKAAAYNKLRLAMARLGLQVDDTPTHAGQARPAGRLASARQRVVDNPLEVAPENQCP